jgi:putative membrane protein
MPPTPTDPALMTTPTAGDDAPPPWTVAERALFAFMVLLLAAHAAIQVYHLTMNVGPLDRINWKVIVPIFAGFTFLSALWLVGWQRALALLITAVGMAWGWEQLGIRTGFPFGAYHYSDVLGWKLLGVPIVVPLAYFMMVFPSDLITNLMVDGEPVTTARSTWFRLGVCALITAMVMTAWDLTEDPLMADQLKAWIWENPGPYFNIPLRNYWGWVLAVGSVDIVYRSLERVLPTRPLGRSTRWVAALPLVGYGVFLASSALIGAPEGTRIVAPFAMGIPLLVAIVRLNDWVPPKS